MGHVQTAPDKYSHDTVEYLQRFCHLPMSRALLSKFKMASLSWATTHPCNHTFAVHKFGRLCIHTAPVKFSTERPKNLTSILAFIFLNVKTSKFRHKLVCQLVEYPPGAVWEKPYWFCFSFCCLFVWFGLVLVVYNIYISERGIFKFSPLVSLWLSTDVSYCAVPKNIRKAFLF